MQLSARIRPRDLEDFFTAVGKVRDVRLITDPRTKRSKGIAYIEFREVDSVPLAIALTGQRLLGVPIIVKLTQAEKNRLPFTGPHIPANLPQDGPIKLYVGSLHVNITEDMLRGIFEPFGAIDAIVLARDDFQRSKGYGFIQFSNAEDGKKAMEQLNNFELASRPIKVSLFISEKSFDTSHVVHVSNLDNDDLDRTGVNLGPSGKLALMAKLAEGTGLIMPQYALDSINMSNVQGTHVQYKEHLNGQSFAQHVEPDTPLTSQCFLLTNMFDLEEEKKKENWIEDIREDVVEECSKYGGVVHVNVDQISPNGQISIKCPTIAIAIAAMNGLNGRYFAGKLIQASFISLLQYHQQFPESVNKTEVLKPSF
jgi:RNA-binding protein 39